MISGAISILGYKAVANNDGSGWQIIPVGLAFGIPVVIAFIIVTIRGQYYKTFYRRKLRLFIVS